MSERLEVAGLTRRFGGLVAVDDVSFRVPPGSVVGLIGINGAGKSTLMNCIAGSLCPDAGRIVFEGRDIAGRPPHEIARAGIGRTFQIPRVFARMTLIDNLMIPVLGEDASDAALIEKAHERLARVSLDHLAANTGEELSGGQQKLLELARVMMLDPRLVLLDEPFAGVNPALCRLVTEQIERLKGEGASVLLISHDLTSIYRLSDHIYVLDRGRVIAEGAVEAIRSDPAVIEAYLGDAA